MTVMVFAVYQVFQQRCQAQRTHLSLQHFLAFANHNQEWRAEGLKNSALLVQQLRRGRDSAVTLRKTPFHFVIRKE